ncbi:putative nuclease HARBI1 [Anabrus simplex]|uniref:putative nuclease HARBI1 n=1 Tax=Anabrus simplex TaxID=316456 RepID=UPI0035A2D9FA
MTAEERYSAVQKFRDAREPFPGTLGAIDCTYLKIIAPKEHEEAYVNHWGDHTLNVQAICDPDLKILNINARYPGARHDAYVWSNSAARRAMERNFTYGERNTWLIGDDGYALEPWLMTPLKNEIRGTPLFQYNEELCAARSVVERLFGVLKGEFRCLSQQRQLMYDPVMSGMIANACAVLHNMRIAHRLDNAVDAVEEQGRIHRVNEEPLLGEEENANQRRAVAQRIQQSLITRHYGRH